MGGGIVVTKFCFVQKYNVLSGFHLKCMVYNVFSIKTWDESVAFA